jgi:KUP system potassium uptake protein
VAEGGWLTLAVASVALLIFTTWYKGRRLGLAAQAVHRVPLAPFVESLALDMPHRVRGTAVFLAPEADVVPHALLHNLLHNQVLHEQVIVLAMRGSDTPRVAARDRITAQDVGHGIWAVTARYGFMERPNVPEFVRVLAYQRGLAIDSMTTSYFTSRAAVGQKSLPGMNPLRWALFAWMQRNAGRASDYFGLPDNRLVEMGQRV